MLDKQAASEFQDFLDLVKENSFLPSSQGEDVRITKENPVEPVEALHNSVQTKLLGAQDDVDRFTADVGNAQKKCPRSKLCSPATKTGYSNCGTRRILYSKPNQEPQKSNT